MKSRLSLISLILFLAMMSGLQAQNASATIFSEDGDRFYLIVNGIRQNGEAATNVKVSDLAANEGARYKLKIIFEDAAKGEIDKYLYPQPGMDMVMAIKYKAKKDEYVLRMSALNELPYEPEPIVYHTEPLPPPAHSTTTINNSGMGVNTNVTVTETQTTTTTVGQPTGETESVTVNMNVGGINMGGSVTVSESYSSSSTTTTTTTTTSGGGAVIVEEPVEEVVYVPGYSGPVGCPVPMGPHDFSDARRSIESKTFEDSKLTMAKQITKSNCLTADQVRDIMKSFEFEDTRLEFAKFAWDYTYDRGNFYKVNDAFTFESSIEELDEYTSGR